MFASGAAHYQRDGMGRLRAGGRGQDQERLGRVSGLRPRQTVPDLATAESRRRSAPAGQWCSAKNACARRPSRFPSGILLVPFRPRGWRPDHPITCDEMTRRTLRLSN